MANIGRGPPQPLDAAAKTVKVKVTFVGAELTENNHVGNEWWYEGYVNGKAIEEGSSRTLSLKTTDKITLKGEAQEQDKIPEDGEGSVSVKASAVTKTITKSVQVAVTENRGRYSGDTATWTFTFKIEKAK
ncbi:hypothetical protein ACFFSY_29790 [Paenibacillus aurantiacus]|uniref:WxL domain-containing protein n=1 Tax=Paenibacillus aurantiacus TaxID=1936118 RepID=A0ABV5KY80_9BACL